jgi:large subunit ribosomal protein L6
MSRIGKAPIAVAENVKVNINWPTVTVEGPRGSLESKFCDNVIAKLEDNVVNVSLVKKTKTARQRWGLTRSLIANMVTGVSEGFKKELIITGVGYKASSDNKHLTLSLGYSHDIKFAIPETVKITCPKPTAVTIEGNDKQIVGQVAAVIRSQRPPEPYKGKGVKVSDEYIVRKEGKKK